MKLFKVFLKIMVAQRENRNPFSFILTETIIEKLTHWFSSVFLGEASCSRAV